MTDNEASAARGVVDRLVAFLGTPPPGQPGVVLAAPGSGKSSLVLHLAERAIASGHCVLVLSIGTTLARLRAQHEVIECTGWRARTPASESSRRRLLMALPKVPQAGALTRQVTTLLQSGAFKAERVVIDGLPYSSDALQEVAAWSAAHALPVWVTMTCHDDACDAPDTQGPVVRLRGQGTTMRLLDAAHRPLPFALDPKTQQLVHDVIVTKPAHTQALTLIHGGSAGAETAFAEAALSAGIRERNLTFDGHRQARSVGAVVVDAMALRRGDVGAAELRTKLGRSFDHNPDMANILRLIWHLVEPADQVFAVGEIQPDGTVWGGTGWAVELAKAWMRELWAFDQPSERWSYWTGNAWQHGTPVVRGPIVCGTGTRHLTTGGLSAIKALLTELKSS